MTPPDAVPEAEPGDPVGRTEHRDGAPAAVADFAGFDVDDAGRVSVASFDDLDEATAMPYGRPNLLGCETTDDGVDDMLGRDTRQMASFGDVVGNDDGSSGVRVASFDGHRPPAGRSSRPRSERARTSARGAPATDRGAADGRAAPGRAAQGRVADGGAEDDPKPDAAGSGDARPRRGRDKRAGGSSRDGRGGGGLSFSPQDDEAQAKEICLRLLTDRARTVQELSHALRRKEIPDDVAARVLERFDEVGLVDDEAFAGQWVRSRHRHRGLGRRAIAAELHHKGVAKEIADEALTEIDAESEENRARELVDRKLRTAPINTTEQRATAARRLVGMLARKGYGGAVAYQVVREAVAARRAEADELGPVDD